MLYRASAIRKLKLKATDGLIGNIQDLYFDDIAWTVRYFVVDMGGWLSDLQVLISPQSITGYSEGETAFTTNLTRKQVAESPRAETEMPVSRQYEEQLSSHYGWYSYWGTPVYPWRETYTYPPYSQTVYPGMSAPLGPGGPVTEELTPNNRSKNFNQEKTHSDPSLRSFLEIKKYGLHAINGDIGKVEDLLIEYQSWRITHLVADARKWWPGGLVVIDKGMIKNISWEEEKFEIEMTKDEIKNAPSFNPREGISQTQQIRLSQYYKRLAELHAAHMRREALPK